MISDNGSTDATGDICGRYAQLDAPVKDLKSPINRGILYDIGSSDGTFGIARNTMRNTGATPTAMFLSLRPTNNPQVQNLVFTANNIRLESDGGTGIEIRRSGNGAAVGFNRNRVEFRDLGAADERGFIFTQVTGTVNLFGTLNTMAVISNGQNGNNFIEVPFFIPANTSNGSVEINGVIFP